MLELLPHVLRSVNQDAAGVEVLEALNKSSGLLVEVWAMKNLPRKYRESQTDWCEKCGIPPCTRQYLLVKLNLIHAHICIRALDHILVLPICSAETDCWQSNSIAFGCSLHCQ